MCKQTTFFRFSAKPFLTGERLFHAESKDLLGTLRTGLSVRLTSNMPSVRCAFLNGCKRFLHCALLSHPKLVTWEKRSSSNHLFPIPWYTLFFASFSNDLFVDDVLWTSCHGQMQLAQSRGRSLRVVASAALPHSLFSPLSPSPHPSLSWRSAVALLSHFDASFKFARASYLVSEQPWSIVRMEQKAFWEILCLVR